MLQQILHAKKMTAVVSGALMGITASFFAMIPAGHRTEAAIAVWDEKNIEQAMEMVKKSAEIKASADAQLAIQILQNKKLDADMLNQWLKKSQDESRVLGGCFGTGKIEDPALKAVLQKKGIGIPETSIEQAWNDRIGDLDRLIKGDANIADVYVSERKRSKALSDTYLDAAKAAKAAGMTEEQFVKDVDVLEAQSANAQGTLQAAQIGNSINARTVKAIAAQTDVLNNLVEMEATKHRKEAWDEMMREKVEEQSDEHAQTFEESYQAKKQK